LAVTAAPRFIDISSDAKKVRHEALTTSIKAAANLGFAKCLLSTSCSQSGESILDIGGRVFMETYSNYGINAPEVNTSTAFSDVCEN